MNSTEGILSGNFYCYAFRRKISDRVILLIQSVGTHTCCIGIYIVEPEIDCLFVANARNYTSKQ